MTEKVLYCIPVYYGVVVSLVFQFVVDGADAAWLLWWIMRSHRDGALTILIVPGIRFHFLS